MELAFALDEVVVDCFGYLSAEDICRSGSICRRWHSISERNFLWKAAYVREWGLPKEIVDRHNANSVGLALRAAVGQVNMGRSNLADSTGLFLTQALSLGRSSLDGRGPSTVVFNGGTLLTGMSSEAPQTSSLFGADPCDCPRFWKLLSKRRMFGLVKIFGTCFNSF